MWHSQNNQNNWYGKEREFVCEYVDACVHKEEHLSL